MANNQRNVRQRTDDDTLHLISDLPDGFLVNVSEYLPKPSKAILAAALSAPSSSWNVNSIPSDVSKAIVSASQWDTLDFEEVNKELANKLTDDDINAILTCVGAKEFLKRLKLCGCINITGIGLYPLRGSVVLEQIDLSLVGKHEEPIELTPNISHEVVLPILDSIMSSDRCSLKYIQFPYNWSVFASSVLVREFRERFDRFLASQNQGANCTRCNAVMNLPINWLTADLENTSLCYDCMDPICNTCVRANNGMASCTHCRKNYCTDCVPVTKCTDCSKEYCRGCSDTKACNECGNATCEKCLDTCGVCNRRLCSTCSCGKVHCDESCYDGDVYNLTCCDDCFETCCPDCKFKEVKNGEYDCLKCSGAIFPMLLEENAKLIKENEELAKDNKELREKVESMSL